MHTTGFSTVKKINNSVFIREFSLTLYRCVYAYRAYKILVCKHTRVHTHTHGITGHLCNNNDNNRKS